MADQELTALKIRIEAEVKQALSQLDSLAAKMVSVEATVKQSVGKINASLNSFSNKKVDVNLEVKGKEKIKELEKQIASLRSAAGIAVNAPSVATNSKIPAVVPSEAEISSFVSSVKSGIATSINEVTKFRSALGALFSQKKLELGVDNTQVLALKKDLEFLNGFLNNAKREVKVRIKAEGDDEIRNKLSNLQQSFALEIIPSFDDSTFNKLLSEVQNKRINLTFEDVSAAIQEEIRKVEAISANLPIGADTSKYDAKLATLRGRLFKVNDIVVDANTSPAQLSLKQLQQKAQAIFARQQTIKIKAEITAPSAELAKLEVLKRRLEADKIRLKGTAEFDDINKNLALVTARIKELNAQGVQVRTNSESFVSSKSIADAQKAVALIKQIKTEGSQVRLDFKTSGLERLNGQAGQTLRNFEQIIRDAPSFAISAQQGFVAIGNNIGPLTDSFGRLATEAKASGTSIGKALLTQLSGWNAVGIAISVAVTAITIFSKELFGANEKTKKLKDKFQEIKELIENTKFVVPDAIGGTKGDIVEARALAAIVENTNKSVEERSRALAELQRRDSDIFKDVSLQAGAYQKVGAAVDDYAAKLVKVASQTSRVSDINKKQAEFNKLDEERIDILGRLEAARREYKPITIFDETGTPVAFEQFEDTSVFKTLTKESNLLKTNIDALGLSISEVIGQAYANASGFAFNPMETKDGGSDKIDDLLKRRLQAQREALESELKLLDERSKRYFEIQTDIAGIDLQINNIGETDKQIKSDNLKVFQNTLKAIQIDAANAGVELFNLVTTISDPAFFQGPNITPFAKIAEDAIIAKQEIDKLFASGELTASQKLEAEVALEFNIASQVLEAQKELNSYELLIKTGIAPQLAPVIPDQSSEEVPELPDLDQWEKDAGFGLDFLNEKFKNMTKPIEEAQKAIADLNLEIANLVASNLSNFFDDIFDGLTNDGVLAFEEVSEAIKKLVFNLIKATVKLLIFRALTSALTGGATGAVGTVASFFTGARPFATGGIVTKPTLGMIGEAGTEAVLPLSYLNNLIGNVGGGGSLSARVSGDDLLFLVEKAGTKKSRYF